jgi:DNA-entry nuclease
MKKLNSILVIVLLSALLQGCAGTGSQTTVENGYAEQISDAEGTASDSSGSVSDDTTDTASDVESADTTDDAISADVTRDDLDNDSDLALEQNSAESVTLDTIPAYSGDAYIILNGNQPVFSDDDKANTDAFEFYSDLDSLGRCGQAYANICPELEPTEERGAIGSVKPSGWHTVKYNDLIDGNYLYNRCHLIGYQLAGENANEKNLITGTRYLNVTGMLPFEDEVDDYVDMTGNHVLYRVTPVFEGDNLVASGVQMEGWSVEDGGSGICFNVFCYNVQPGVGIDYASGDSWESDEVSYNDITYRHADTENDTAQEIANSGNENETQEAAGGTGEQSVANSGSDTETQATENSTASGSIVVIPAVGSSDSAAGSTVEANTDAVTSEYIANKNTKKFHIPDCSSVSDMAEKNKVYYSDTTVEEMEALGYSPCKRCLN